MILDARSLTVAQLCPRRWKLESTEPRGRWHPKALFDAILRQAILDLSIGKSKESVTLQAQAKFRVIAKSPGLDTLADPWTIAGDYCACLETILEALSRQTLLPLQIGQAVKLDKNLDWRVSAFQDDSGELHRWATVERVDADTLARELHSWHVFGDMGATGAPMTLHLIELGTMRAGRRHSPWCKIFKHPVVAGHFRFRARTGAKLAGAWKPVWYADSSSQDPEKWVNLIESDKLTLIHHIPCKPLNERARESFKWQVRAEAKRLASLGDWSEIPMSRPACDAPYVCPWQSRCFSL